MQFSLEPELVQNYIFLLRIEQNKIRWFGLKTMRPIKRFTWGSSVGKNRQLMAYIWLASVTGVPGNAATLQISRSGFEHDSWHNFSTVQHMNWLANWIRSMSSINIQIASFHNTKICYWHRLQGSILPVMKFLAKINAMPILKISVWLVNIFQAST